MCATEFSRLIIKCGKRILRMYEHHFYKADWQELDISTSSIQRRLIEAA